MSYNFHSIWCSFVTLLLVTIISVLISIFWYYFSQLGSDRIQSLFAFFQILENSAMQFIRSVFGRTSEVWIVEGGGIVFISTFMFLNAIHFEKMHMYIFHPWKKVTLHAQFSHRLRIEPRPIQDLKTHLFSLNHVYLLTFEGNVA